MQETLLRKISWIMNSSPAPVPVNWIFNESHNESCTLKTNILKALKLNLLFLRWPLLGFMQTTVPLKSVSVVPDWTGLDYFLKCGESWSLTGLLTKVWWELVPDWTAYQSVVRAGPLLDCLPKCGENWSLTGLLTKVWWEMVPDWTAYQSVVGAGPWLDYLPKCGEN